MSELELGPLWVSLKLGLATVVCLLLIATPLAWWLAFTRSRARAPVEAVVALPLVLPPTVLGFYLLILLSPEGWIGRFWIQVSDAQLTFSFTGLVIASIVYSLPFAVQPLQGAFESVGKGALEAGATLGASPARRFVSIVLPLSARGYLSAMVLVFAHTLGEFGVVLMVGGNIPGRTNVISIAVFEQVETLNYAQAHFLSAILLLSSFLLLMLLFGLNRRLPIRFPA